MTDPIAPPEMPRDPVAAANLMSTQLIGLREDLKKVTGRERFTRRLSVGLAVSLLADLIVTVLLAVALHRGDVAEHQSRRNEATADQLRAASEQGCRINNQFKAGEVSLWDFLASLSTPAPGETHSQIVQGRHKVSEFLAYVRKVNQPRDCARAYRAP